MKGEVRGLKSGTYFSKDDSCLFKVSKNDLGVKLEMADLDADIFYEFVIDEEGKVNFNWGQVNNRM